MPPPFDFDVYGFHFRVSGSATQAIENLRGDFSHFASGPLENPTLIELLQQAPPYELAPAGAATVYTPRNISFRSGPVTWFDYSGRALACHDKSTSTFRVYSEHNELLSESAYLFLLAHVSEFLDGRGLHRVHALGMSLNGRALLVLLPMGGGKSTLAWDLMRFFPKLQLLSDDSPLIDRHGQVHAFPLRLGLLPGHEAEVPPEYRRTFQRIEFGPKIAVHYRYFADRVVPQAGPGLLLLGRRSLSTGCTIEPAGITAGMRSMLTNCVVGLGLFQGMEFVFNNDLLTVIGKASTALSRARNALTLTRASQVCYVTLGRDLERNARSIYEYAEKQLT